MRYHRDNDHEEEPKDVLEEQKRVLYRDQICKLCSKAIPAKQEHYYLWGKLHDQPIGWRMHQDCFYKFKNPVIEQPQTLPC